MEYKKIAPLDVPPINDPVSVYDEEGFTALELACRLLAKLNESIHTYNRTKTEVFENLPGLTSEWLEAHPEITTSLQDNEILMSKLNSSLAIKEFYTPQMFGAVGDGQTDDTTSIQAAIDAGINVYIPDGTYLINAKNDGWGHTYKGGIRPKSGSTIIMSPGATLKASADNNGFYNIICLTDVENVAISGGRIIGDRDDHTGTTGEFGYGIGIYECNRVLIENVEISKCWGDGIMLGVKNELTGENNNIHIDKCVIHDCRRQGISACNGGKNVTITNCHIYNISGTAPQSGIDIEPNQDPPFDGLVISGCTIHDTVGASIVVSRARNTHINDCNLEDINIWSNSDHTYIENCLIRTIFTFGSETLCSNSRVDFLSLCGGGGTFSGCQFETTGNMANAIVFSGTDGDGKADHVIFNGCTFRTGDGIQLLQNQGLSKAKNMIFTGCKFYGIHKTIKTYEDPVSFIGCVFQITADPYILFEARAYNEHATLTIENCEFDYGSNVARTPFLFDVTSSTNTPIVIARNNKNLKIQTGMIVDTPNTRYICVGNIFDKEAGQAGCQGSAYASSVITAHDNIFLS